MIWIKFEILIIYSETALHREPILNCVFHVPSLLSQLIQLSKYRTCKHILDQYFSSTFWVKEEKELSYSCDDVKWVKVFLQILKLWESGHQLKYVVFQIFLFQIAITCTIVQTDLNSGLEQIYFSYHVMEEWYNFDSAILVTFEFEESWWCEELPAFWRQHTRHIDELIIIDPLSLIFRQANILFEQVPQLF